MLDPSPPRRGVRTQAGAARFARLAEGETHAAVGYALIEEAGLSGLAAAQLVGRAGVPWSDRDHVVSELDGRIVRSAGPLAEGDAPVTRSADGSARSGVGGATTSGAGAGAGATRRGAQGTGRNPEEGGPGGGSTPGPRGRGGPPARHTYRGPAAEKNGGRRPFATQREETS